MSNPICPNCGKDASNTPPMVPRGCEGWCLKCIQERPDEQSGKKCSKCKGSLHLKKDGNEISWCYHLTDKKDWKVCENCWQQEEKNYRNHDWWGIRPIHMSKPTDDGDSDSGMSSEAANRVIYDWNTQKWVEKDLVEGDNNPPLEVIEEEKKKIRQYLKDKGIQKVKHSGSSGLNIEYADGRKENNNSIDAPYELFWINSYFSYLAKEKGISNDNEKELSKLFFGQETDSSNDSEDKQREREREQNWNKRLLI